MNELKIVPPRRARGRPRADEGPSSSTILDAALDAFAIHGWDGANLRRIAEAAGVDTALIVRRFDGKMGLWCAVVDNVAAAMKASYLPEVDVPLGERLRWAIERFVQFNIDRPGLGRFFIDEITRPGLRRDYVMQHIWSVHREQMLPMLRAAESAGLLPPGSDAENFLATMTGAVVMPLMMRGVVLDSLDTPEGQAAFKHSTVALLTYASPAGGELLTTLEQVQISR